MLPVTWTTIRLFLHVLAATVWVGGQLTLAGLVPGLRARYPDAPNAAARRFNLIAWPAYGTLVATGIWNLLAVDLVWSSDLGTTVIVKLVVVGISGVSAFVHTRAKSTVGLAVFGTVTALSALGALFLGVALRA